MDDIDRKLEAIAAQTRTRYAVLHRVLVWVEVDLEAKQVTDAYTSRSFLSEAEVLSGSIYPIDPDDGTWEAHELAVPSPEADRVVAAMEGIDVQGIRVEEHL